MDFAACETGFISGSASGIWPGMGIVIAGGIQRVHSCKFPALPPVVQVYLGQQCTLWGVGYQSDSRQLVG